MLLLTDSSFFFLRHTICCCCNLSWIFAGSTACIVNDRRPTTLANSRRVVDSWAGLKKSFYKGLEIFCNFSSVNDKVISIDFFIFIIKPKFCRRYMSVSWLMWASRIVWLKINLSSKYIITLILIFLRRKIGISITFVNALGALNS